MQNTVDEVKYLASCIDGRREEKQNTVKFIQNRIAFLSKMRTEMQTMNTKFDTTTMDSIIVELESVLNQMIPTKE